MAETIVSCSPAISSIKNAALYVIYQCMFKKDKVEQDACIYSSKLSAEDS